MKKISRFVSILAILLFAVSCQDSDIDGGQTIDNGKLNLTATIVAPDATRVTYDVDNASTHTITPSWTVGDEIIGWDDQGETFTFSVAAVDGSGRATLDAGSYVPGAATKLYAIYSPDNVEGDIAGGKLTVNLGTQSGVLDDDSPVLMCATAEITAGSASLSFENQTAIIGVTKFKLPAAATVTSISVDGLITSGTFEVDGGGNLVLTPAAAPATATATGSWATGAGNICETAIYFATLPTAGAKIALRASDGANDYGNLASIAATDIAAGNYYYMQKNLGAPVAAVNGVKYGTIDDAWAAANAATAPVTIKLLSNCTAATELTLNGSGTGAVTLDLNGKTLTENATNHIVVTGGRSLTVGDSFSDNPATQGTIQTADGTEATRTITVQGGSSLSINGGRIISNPAGSSTVSAAVYACEASTVTISGGFIRGESASEGVVYLFASAEEPAATKCSLTMTGGEILSNTGQPLRIFRSNALVSGGTLRLETVESGKHVAYINNTTDDISPCSVEFTGDVVMTTPSARTSVYPQAGAVTISGGTYQSERYAVYAYGSKAVVTVTGGTFRGKQQTMYSGSGAHLTISGGDMSTTGNYVVAYATGAASVLTITGGRFKTPGRNSVGNNSGAGTVHVTGGIFNKPVRRAFATDGATAYVNVLNEDAETKADFPFTVSSTVGTPEVAYTAYKSETDTFSHGTLQSAAQAINIASKEQDFHLTADVTTASRVSIRSSVKTNLYLEDHTITGSVARLVEAFSDMDIHDGPLGKGGIINTTANYALVDSIANTKLNIYGGTFRTAGATYGALRFWGYSSKLTIDDSEGNPLFENTGSGAAVNIGGTSSASAPMVDIAGGTFIAQKGVALRCGYGVTDVTGGTFVGSTSAAQTLNTGNLLIHGGYFHNGGSSEPIIVSHAGTNGHVDGGWFSKEPLPAVVAMGYKAESGSTTVGSRDYTYQVVEDPDAAAVATVNETGYSTFAAALEAALAYDGGDAMVTLKLLSDVTGWTDQLVMDNASGKPIVFDLNGHTFGVAIDSAMTTSRTLTIKDGSGTGTGKYTSNMRKQIYLFGSGTVNITNCTVECTRSGYMATGAIYTMIAVAGTSGAKTGKVSLDNAKVYANSYFKPFYVEYGTLNFTDSEITCGSESAGGWYIVDVNTGGSVTVDNSSFLTFDRTNGDKYGCIHSRTGDIGEGSSIVINSGWFYSGKALSCSNDEYSKVFTINGGYFNVDFTAGGTTMTQAVYGTGKSLQSITPANHTHEGNELSYGYQVK